MKRVTRYDRVVLAANGFGAVASLICATFEPWTWVNDVWVVVALLQISNVVDVLRRRDFFKE